MSEPTSSADRGAYPGTPRARDLWIVSQRPRRNRLDPRLPYAFLAEHEPGRSDPLVPLSVATVFLTNRECPWRCLMCDLWRNTLEHSVQPGDIPAQIRHALEHLPEIEPARSELKLYNAGSFFDPRAIPVADDPEIARLAAPFARTIVECHPALVGPRCFAFQDALERPLEVALGLETVHPEILDRLNKRMTLDLFRRAVDALLAREITVRTFILVRPPWLSEQEGIDWACRSLEFAVRCGVTTCCLIPTRAGNGAMDTLAAQQAFAPPSLESLETVLAHGLGRYRPARVLIDLWDIDALASCPACSAERIARLHTMNARQAPLPATSCPLCSAASDASPA